MAPDLVRRPVGDAPCEVPAGIEGLCRVDPLTAELWAAYRCAEWSEQPGAGARIRAEIAGLERRGGGDAFAACMALAVLPELSACMHAGPAAARLASSGAPAPAWIGDIGRPQFVQGFLAGDAYGDTGSIWAYFRYPHQPCHLVWALVDYTAGGVCVDAAVVAAEPGGEHATLALADPDVQARRAGLPELASVVVPALLAIPCGSGSREFVQLRPLVLARLISGTDCTPRLPPSRVPTAGDAERLVELLSARVPDAAGRLIEELVAARSRCPDGDPARLSPAVLEMLLLDELPLTMTLDEIQSRNALSVIRAWVHIDFACRGLGDHLLEETLAALDVLGEPFLDAMHAPPPAGAAALLLQAMCVDGVDLWDASEVADWIRRFA